MTDRRRVLAALLRTNFAAFAMKVFQTLEPGTPFMPNWHQDALAYHLDQVRTGKLKRLVINLPPRSAKSIYASVALCAFWHGHDPSKKIACVSYSGELTGKLMRDYRTVLSSDWYRQLFPATRIGPEKNTESEIHLTARGCRLAWPITGTITGRGADLIIVDDPIKAEDAFSETIRNGVNERFDGTILSRLDQKAHAAVIVVMQRFHPEDLSGHALSQPGWTHLRLPAIAEAYEVVPTGADTAHIRQKGEALHPEREPLELLQKERKKHNRGNAILGPVSAIAGAGRGQSDQVGLVRTLRHRARAPSRVHRAKLGHRRQGRRAERLLSLSHLPAHWPPSLPVACAA